ncbi:MAG: CotH kinase family protein [Phycisphaerales bacterium]|nr:MAG: CotH kinase family protein [Phycisphaerales bacterium]
MIAILFGVVCVLSPSVAGNTALKIDFTPIGGSVEAGFEAYYADHESAATFTEQSYSAFGTTVWIVPIWPGNPAQQAMQMIERSSGSDLVIDWIGTDARVDNADSLVLIVAGLSEGTYTWTSYHHDPQDQTGLFSVTITDAAGSVTVTDIDISNGPLATDDMTRFRTIIVSDGTNPVMLSFENQGYHHVSEAFFVMNALVLESLDSASDVPPGDDVPEWPAGDVDGSGPMISEFVASNRKGLADGDGNTPDWIELYNHGAEPVSLDGWCLTDDEDNLRKWPFPPGTLLGAGGYLVVFASSQPEDDYVDQQGFLHTNFALDKDGEYLALVDGSGGVVHEFAPAFPTQAADTSYGIWQGQERYFEQPTPGSANRQPFLGLVARTVHSQARGFYDQPFELEISCDTPGTVIRYTLDGSEPTEQTRRLHDPNDPILITTTTHVRSLASKPGWRSAPVTTHSYIFVDDVAQQPADPPGWPTDWGYSSDAGAIVPADYEMDPRVVNSTLPGYSMREALLDIPTMSISMHPDDFISDATGIYANPQSRWERKCSVEYIFPDGDKGFQYDCKVEIHGNASRRPYRMQKHSLRLTFTSQYGPSKLEYPLFSDSDVEEFNQLVLRASFTDSWALVSWSSSTRYRPNDSQYIRDVWMKDSLRDMGQPSSHGRFVHLYVNGLYFGIHNLTERVGEDFFASHLGGAPEDWEVNEDLSSPRSRWNAMLAIDPSTPAGYAQMQEYLDVENFADYMLLHFYADAEDWPHHNGYAAVNAISGDGKYRFFVWDQEIVLDYHGRAASRVDSAGGAGAIFQKMRTSTEFRLLFADRVYKHCFNDGALSMTASQQRYLTLANEIDRAIVAESARWGDTQMSTPYGNAIEQPRIATDINDNLYPPAPHGPDYYFTREDSWVVERDNVIDNYIPAIHDTANSYALLNVLRARNLYPDIDPPRFQINGAYRHGGLVSVGDLLTMVDPGQTATIYYTLDGTDPRAPQTGGTLNVQTLVAEDAVKVVWVPTTDIGLSWTGGAEPFDDSGWTSAIPAIGETSGGVGYERNTGYESFIGYDVASEMYGNMEACYIRIPFTVEAQDVAGSNFMHLRMRFDDGFVAYLNGTPIASANAPAAPAWNSGATASHSDLSALSWQTFDCSAATGSLRAGDNILAIHGMNAGLTSSDFLISAELVVGEDLRSGELSPSATAYTAPIPLTDSAHVKARLWGNGQWSALNEAVYTVSP